MLIVRMEQTQASSANAVTLSPVTLPRDLSVHLARPFPFFPFCPPTCTRYLFSATFSVHLLPIHPQYSAAHNARAEAASDMASEEQRKAFAAYMGVGNAATNSAATPHFPAMGTGVGQVGQVRLPCERMGIKAYHRTASRFQVSGRNWGVYLLRLRGRGLKAYRAQRPGSGYRDSVLSVRRRLDKVKCWDKQVKGSRRARARDRDRATRCSHRHPFRECSATTLHSHGSIARTVVMARMASCQRQGGSLGTWWSSTTILHSMYLGTHRSYHRVCQCCYAILAVSAAECVQLDSIGMYPLQSITD
jgi:hypothetical protein